MNNYYDENNNSQNDRPLLAAVLTITMVATIAFAVLGVLGVPRAFMDKEPKPITTVPKVVTRELTPEEKARLEEEMYPDPTTTEPTTPGITEQPTTTTTTTSPVKELRIGKKYYLRGDSKEYVNNTNDELLKGLKNYGFKSSNKCRLVVKGDTCYANNTYKAIITGNSPYGRIEFYQDLTDAQVKKYDATKFLEMVSKIYNRKISKEVIKKVNNVIHAFEFGKMQSLTLIEDNLYMNFLKYSDTELEVVVDYWIDRFPEGISTTQVSTILSDKYDLQSKKLLLDLYMVNNKNLFPYMDYFERYLSKTYVNICEINITDNNLVRAHATFCGGGTSNTWFELQNDTYGSTYNDKSNQIIVQLKKDYFEANYNTFINNDLAYINKKINTNFKLSNNNIKDIKDFIKKPIEKEDEVQIKVDDLLYLIIKHSNYSEYTNYYEITYVILK